MRKVIPALILSVLTLSGAAFSSESTKIAINEKICVEMALKQIPAKAKYPERSETVLKAKEHYYRYLMNRDMSDLLVEVKGNFESALEKAEERFDEDDVSISQSDILKLKLGLVGVQKDLNEIEKDMNRARAGLLILLGLNRDASLQFPEEGLTRTERALPPLKACFLSAKKKKSPFDLPEIELAHINLQEKNENLEFVKQGRKYSRGLLVVALANFDMGIGEGKDIFEALYIYNRAVRDYVKGVYLFNLAIAELDRLTGEGLAEQ